MNVPIDIDDTLIEGDLFGFGEIASPFPIAMDFGILYS